MENNLKPTVALLALAWVTGASANDLPDWWIPHEQTDRFDGKSTIGATAPARSTGYFPQRRPAEMGKTANLRVLCAKGETIVYVELANQLIASNGMRVSYKFDDKKPVENQRWEASADSTAAGFWGGSKAIALAKAIEASRTLTIRTDHDVFGRMEAEFETSNAARHFAPIKSACRWKP